MDLIHRFVFEHRRMLAAAFTGLAVLTALGAVRQAPDGLPVLVAAHDLTSGQVIRGGDVHTIVVPPGAQASRALDREAAVGSRVAGPMRKGETLTDYRVLRGDSLAPYGAHAVLTSVRIDETEGLTGVQVGSRVDIVAVDPNGEASALVVARGVEVVILPNASGDSRSTTLGIVTTEKVALALASAALESRFSVITSS